MFAQFKITAIVIATVAFLALIGYSVVMTNKYQAERKEKKELIAYSTNQASEIERYKNKYGNEVSKTEVLTLSVKTLRKLQEEDRLLFLKEFESLKKNLNNLKQAQNITTETVNKFKSGLVDTVFIRGNDTIRLAKSFRYITEYDSIVGIVYPDSVEIDYKIEVPLSGIIYKEKRPLTHYILFWKLFNKREWKTEFTSRNPNTKITSIDLIEIQ